MATASYSFNLPTVGGDVNNWGDLLNANWEAVDDLLDGTTPVDGIDIDGGSIDGATVGATTPSTGAFTTLSASSTFTASSVDINGGTIDDTAIGSVTRSTGAFTTATATNLIASVVDIDSGNIDATVIGDSTAAAGTFTILEVTSDTTLGLFPNDEITVNAAFVSSLRPLTDDTYDLGTASLQWRDLYIDGTANIDSLVADTADINGGTIDGATIGGNSAAAGTFTTITASGTLTIGGQLLHREDTALGSAAGDNRQIAFFDTELDTNDLEYRIKAYRELTKGVSAWHDTAIRHEYSVDNSSGVQLWHHASFGSTSSDLAFRWGKESGDSTEWMKLLEGNLDVYGDLEVTGDVTLTPDAGVINDFFYTNSTGSGRIRFNGGAIVISAGGDGNTLGTNAAVALVMNDTLVEARLPLRVVPTTVASLPSAAAVGAGSTHFVTNANSTTFASVVVGGGSNGVPVYSDGTNWRIG